MFRILIIDDEQNYAVAIKYAIEALGDYKVSLAATGEEGFNTALEQKPDLVLLDIMLPGDDGLKTLKRMKQDPALKDLPVIMLTAVETEKAIQEAKALGVLDYLNKPFEVEMLEKMLKKLIGNKQ